MPSVHFLCLILCLCFIVIFPQRFYCSASCFERCFINKMYLLTYVLIHKHKILSKEIDLKVGRKVKTAMKVTLKHMIYQFFTMFIMKEYVLLVINVFAMENPIIGPCMFYDYVQRHQLASGLEICSVIGNWSWSDETVRRFDRFSKINKIVNKK